MKDPKKVFDMHMKMFSDVLEGRKCLSDITPAHSGDCDEADSIDFSNPEEVHAAIDEAYAVFNNLPAFLLALATGQRPGKPTKRKAREPLVIQPLAIKQLD
jgi:hypothetical protein